jgi:hypothetical protein
VPICSLGNALEEVMARKQRVVSYSACLREVSVKKAARSVVTRLIKCESRDAEHLIWITIGVNRRLIATGTADRRPISSPIRPNDN